VLGLGGAARIVEPTELATAVRERAREALRIADASP
jgi:proteasome accessory factor C